MPQQEITPLKPAEETVFRRWAQDNNIPDVDSPESFYDYRGYWKEYGNKPVRFGVDHFPDTYKQHGHPTFSVESKYSSGPNDGGRWEGETFVPPIKTTSSRYIEFEGKPYEFPSDATDQEISAFLGAIPQANAPTAPKAKTLTALAMATGAKAAPIVQQGVEEFATNPGAWKTARAVGELAGGVAGAAKAGPLGMATGAYVGGKAGYRLSNVAQRAAAPIASTLEKVAPYVQALKTASGAQGVLDLAQMNEPARTDIGTLGVSIGTPRSDEEKAAHPALINLALQKVSDAIDYLMSRGVPRGEATRTVMNIRVKNGAK